MAQLTIFKPDNSCAEIISISDSLYNLLINNAEKFEQEYLTLAFLEETQNRALFLISKKFETNNQEQVKGLTFYLFDWVEELTDVIIRIEKLDNSDALIINLSD